MSNLYYPLKISLKCNSLNYPGTMNYVECNGQMYVADDIFIWNKKPHLFNFSFKDIFLEKHFKAMTNIVGF